MLLQKLFLFLPKYKFHHRELSPTFSSKKKQSGTSFQVNEQKKSVPFSNLPCKYPAVSNFCHPPYCVLEQTLSHIISHTKNFQHNIQQFHRSCNSIKPNEYVLFTIFQIHSMNLLWCVQYKDVRWTFSNICPYSLLSNSFQTNNISFCFLLVPNRTIWCCLTKDQNRLEIRSWKIIKNKFYHVV